MKKKDRGRRSKLCTERRRGANKLPYERPASEDGILQCYVSPIRNLPRLTLLDYISPVKEALKPTVTVITLFLSVGAPFSAGGAGILSSFSLFSFLAARLGSFFRTPVC